MQTKSYNSYKITHKNGDVEQINAENLIEALQSMEITEEYSPVIQTYMAEEGIRTLVNTLPEEVPFTAVVAEGSGGSIATPVSGKIHAGDQIALKAIPARNYEFVNWKMNDKVISEEASLLYTMPELDGEASAVFKATFKLAPVAWESGVSPEGAGTAGCLAFPMSGTVEANGSLSLLAVEADGYAFDHWERNGESVGTNKILSATVTPLAEGEETAEYVAVFTAL
jgi:hypothetical protein